MRDYLAHAGRHGAGARAQGPHWQQELHGEGSRRPRRRDRRVPARQLDRQGRGTSPSADASLGAGDARRHPRRQPRSVDEVLQRDPGLSRSSGAAARRTRRRSAGSTCASPMARTTSSSCSTTRSPRPTGAAPRITSASSCPMPTRPSRRSTPAPRAPSYTRPVEIRTGINRKRQVNLFDPDGTRVELMEPNTIDGKPTPSSTLPPPR